MSQQNARDTAQMMLRLHGLRAQAIAQERTAEMRQQGDAAGFDHWQRVHAEICDLRRPSALHRSYHEHRLDHRS